MRGGCAVNRATRDIDTRSVGNDEARPAPQGPHPRFRLLVNWLLALLTVPVAVVALVFGIGAVMSTSGCSTDRCRGPSGLVFELLFYGAPVIAALTIVISFFTARRRWGVVMPLCGLALLAADVAVMAVSFRT
jgi:hypothetical protein